MTGIEAAFTGRLGRDAELRMVKDGSLPLLTFTVAAEQQHQTEDTPAVWVRVAAFNDLAEQMAERLVKGVRVYVEGRLTAELWEPGDGRPPRVNLQVVANVLQPMGQIGRQRPRQTRSTRGINAELGQRAGDRARTARGGAGRAQAAGEAILAERERTPEPPQDFLDDSAEAMADLEGRGR